MAQFRIMRAPRGRGVTPLLALMRCKAIGFERDTMMVIDEIDHDLCYSTRAPVP